MPTAPSKPQTWRMNRSMETDRRHTEIPPGSTIGILGGGQLGRMIAIDAARLGYRCHVFTPVEHAPAAQVCEDHTIAPFEDLDALEKFARAVDVVTLEFENVPAASLESLVPIVPVRPGVLALSTSQDRGDEKAFLNGIGVPTAAFRLADTEREAADAVRDLGAPAILKTRRMGYDGKGQAMVHSPEEAAKAFAANQGVPAIIEAVVDFTMEISVIAARGVDESIVCYCPVENRHRNHILDQTLVPASISSAQEQKAIDIAERIAKALDVVGLVAVEMFVAQDGEILVNELAPRPHNSGHWSIDACRTSQFEQHVRAICGLVLGPVDRHGDAMMKNLLGDEIHQYHDFLNDPAAKLHVYGKTEPRPGRKMGHVTRLIRS